MPQLLAVKQGHVYEGGNRSGRRWEENLKSLSLTLSLSLSPFLSRRSLHPAQSTRITLYVNTHAQRERQTRAAKKAPAHAHTRAPPSLFHSQRQIFLLSIRAKIFPLSRIFGIVEEDYKPRGSRAIIDIGDVEDQRIKKGNIPRRKLYFEWPVCSPKKNATGSRVLYSYALVRGQEKRRTDFQPGGHRLSPQPAGRWVVAPLHTPIARSVCRTTTGRRSPCSPFSFPSLHLPRRSFYFVRLSSYVRTSLRGLPQRRLYRQANWVKVHRRVRLYESIRMCLLVNTFIEILPVQIYRVNVQDLVNARIPRNDKYYFAVYK